MARIYRKALALSLLLAVCIVSVELLAAPIWRAYRGNQETIAELRGDLARYQQVAATRAETSRLLDRLVERGQREALTLSAQNLSRAAAALQENVKALLDAGGGKLMSTRMLPAEEQGSFYRLVAQVRLQADTETLGPVLYALESSFPYLFLDGLSVVSRGARRSRKRTMPSIPLDVSVEVVAYLRADELAPEAGR
jgi:general secretion pathway protein M